LPGASFAELEHATPNQHHDLVTFELHRVPRRTRTSIRHWLVEDRDAVAGARPAIDNASDLDLRDGEICSNSETMAYDSAFSYQIPESVSRRVGAVCAGCRSHTDAVPCGINIAPHVVLSAGVKEQGCAPLQCLAVTGSVCLGFHHGGAACKTHRPGGAIAELNLGKVTSARERLAG
jgi:hypothetical protein